MAEEIEITIDPSGKVTARTKGMKGAQCMEWADLLVQIVGNEVSRQKTGEFYEQDENAVRRQEIKQGRS
jgi:Protein of unknown function (DUF2997)